MKSNTELFAQRYSKLLVTLAIWASSFSAIFARLSKEMPPLAIAFYRLSFSLPVFLIILFSQKKNTEKLRALNLQQVSMALSAGAFLAVHFISWFSAVARTSIANASVLCAMHPVFIIILSNIILKERPTWQMTVAILLSMLGAFIMAGTDYSVISKTNLFGDLFAILAALFLSCYWIIGRSARKKIPADIYITLAFFSCWFVLLVGMMLSKTRFNGYNPKAYFWVFLMAITCQVIAHAGMNWGLAYVSPLFMSALDNSSVVITTALGILFFHEYPGDFQIIGGTTAIVGLIIYNYYEERRSSSTRGEINERNKKGECATD